MLVDSGEDEWQRLHDVRLNGTVLEYIGRGKSLVDVGLAQARTPIGTRNHYFEIEVSRERTFFAGGRAAYSILGSHPAAPGSNPSSAEILLFSAYSVRSTEIEPI